MKKQEQLEVNKKCLAMIEEFNREVEKEGYMWDKWQRLRSCTAHVNQTTRFVALRSYNTIVAIIDKNTDTLYDVLRYVYGYTATSAQHIAKFDHDCGYGKWGCTERLTYR